MALDGEREREREREKRLRARDGRAGGIAKGVASSLSLSLP
jgi:hypothetical protein